MSERLDDHREDENGSERYVYHRSLRKHRSHRRRKGPLRRLKHRIKKVFLRRKWLPFALLASLMILAVIALLLMREVRQQQKLNVFAGNSVDVGAGFRIIEYNGKEYHYNNRITTILFAGVDSTDALLPHKQYTQAPRADSISLLVMDALSHRMYIIALNRDTMTDIHRYSLNGKDRGLFEDHLGYAFTYGDGGEASCENLRDAVSRLLFGIPIDEYVVVNRSALPGLSDIIGPVDVVVPNDDLADIGMERGQTVTITADNLADFVRSRDTAEDLSNVGRMERQKTFVNAAADRTMSLLKSKPSQVWDKVVLMEDYTLMSIKRSKYLDLVRTLKLVQYDQADYIGVEGKNVVGERYDEFYPDRDKLLEQVVELFYIAS